MDNSAQIDYWNGAAGEKWVRDADRLDRMLQPFAEAVLAAAKPVAGERIIDIGCGAGALSFAASEAGALTTGVDVSEPLIAIARRRAEQRAPAAQFVVADASAWAPDTKADLVVSRFGVMFFADPAKAFASIRKGTKPGGRLAFACWRPLAENDWALMPIVAALPFLKEPPAPPPPGTPGPFAFGSRDFVSDVLAQAGWSAVRITPWDGTIELPGANPEDTADFMLEIGPLSRAIAEQGVDRAKVKDALVSQVRRLAGAEGRTHLKAAVWIVEATA
ncbi:class I SAM-dependent methyltransferase [Hyphomonas sp.]|uniref:class I SAM-dependent methyltransferase n=1 Tax=Hyphomonas sp. TaxID=87 RepID=UPI0025C01CE9|nr:class I SAM-dependent methyltransferase [Hyphomonas sp.]